MSTTNQSSPIASPYPLEWPAGWPRTVLRDDAAFKTDTPKALNRLKRELGLMGAKNVILSSNYTLGIENPKDPGVCAYFEWDSGPMAIPCDRWKRISHNIQAIALTVEAMRGMERWGAKHMIKAMFSGFKRLSAGDMTWWISLGLDNPNVNIETVKARYRDLVKKHHPDTGGNPEDFRRIQIAYETALSVL